MYAGSVTRKAEPTTFFARRLLHNERPCRVVAAGYLSSDGIRVTVPRIEGEAGEIKKGFRGWPCTFAARGPEKMTVCTLERHPQEMKHSLPLPSVSCFSNMATDATNVSTAGVVPGLRVSEDEQVVSVEKRDGNGREMSEVTTIVAVTKRKTVRSKILPWKKLFGVGRAIRIGEVPGGTDV